MKFDTAADTVTDTVSTVSAQYQYQYQTSIVKGHYTRSKEPLVEYCSSDRQGMDSVTLIIA